MTQQTSRGGCIAGPVRVIATALLIATLSACSDQTPAGLKRQLWVPDDGSFSVNVPQPPSIQGSSASDMQYRFYHPDKRAPGPLLEVEVQLKNPYSSYAHYTTDAFYDIYEHAYGGERGAVVNTTQITNNGYRGRQFEITAGPRAPRIVRLFSTDHRTYFVEWNPTVPHATETADTFYMPQGATQP